MKTKIVVRTLVWLCVFTLGRWGWEQQGPVSAGTWAVLTLPYLWSMMLVVWVLLAEHYSKQAPERPASKPAPRPAPMPVVAVSAEVIALRRTAESQRTLLRETRESLQELDLENRAVHKMLREEREGDSLRRGRLGPVDSPENRVASIQAKISRLLEATEGAANGDPV